VAAADDENLHWRGHGGKPFLSKRVDDEVRFFFLIDASGLIDVSRMIPAADGALRGIEAPDGSPGMG
jgi:hypothetical protein